MDEKRFFFPFRGTLFSILTTDSMFSIFFLSIENSKFLKILFLLVHIQVRVTKRFFFLSKLYWEKPIVHKLATHQ